jgi:hypothetical protein
VPVRGTVTVKTATHDELQDADHVQDALARELRIRQSARPFAEDRGFEPRRVLPPNRMRAAATLAMLRAWGPRRAMMASRAWWTGVPAGVRWTASISAERSGREPCLVIRPRENVR